MNFLGKIFTTIIFILSVMFMAFSIMVFATHRNWKDRAEQLEQDLDTQVNVNRSLEEEVEQTKETLARERAARKSHVAALTTSKQAAEQRVAQLNEQNTELQGNVDTLMARNQNVDAELDRLTSEVSELRTQLREARSDRDEQYELVVSLTDKLNQLQGEKEVLESTRNTLLAQNARMKSVLNRNGLTEFDDVANIPPRVNGVVMAVGDTKYIEISLGADDGLKEGHTLEVYRNNQYLGRVVVRRTSPDRAVAEVLDDFRKGIIRKGDRVATRLS